MKSLLHILQDSESVLLMHLAGELPPEDQAEVDAMLATDAGLRHQLEILRASHDQVSATFAQADQAVAHRIAVTTARKQADRAIAAWSVRRTLQPLAVAPRSPLRQWLVYTASAAAVIALATAGFVIFSTPEVRLEPTEIAVQYNGLSPSQRLFAQSMADPSPRQMVEETAQLIQPSEEQDLLLKSLDVSDELLLDSVRHKGLHDAESQMARLDALADADAMMDGVLFQ